MNKVMNRKFNLFGVVLPTLLLISSCKTLVHFQDYDYDVMNLDETGKANNQKDVIIYDKVDISFEQDNNKLMNVIIENKTPDNLVIDKSKSFVVTNGYGKELFKDVRTTRNATFSYVDGAVNTVTTQEGGVTMTIPPYSKFRVPVEETNVEAVNLPDVRLKLDETYTPFTTNNNLEFIIPYSFDLTGAEWTNTRNRIFLSKVKNSKKRLFESGFMMDETTKDDNGYHRKVVTEESSDASLGLLKVFVYVGIIGAVILGISIGGGH